MNNVKSVTTVTPGSERQARPLTKLQTKAGPGTEEVTAQTVPGPATRPEGTLFEKNVCNFIVKVRHNPFKVVTAFCGSPEQLGFNMKAHIVES
jgi:hypothetical protein